MAILWFTCKGKIVCSMYKSQKAFCHSLIVSATVAVVASEFEKPYDCGIFLYNMFRSSLTRIVEFLFNCLSNKLLWELLIFFHYRVVVTNSRCIQLNVYRLVPCYKKWKLLKIQFELLLLHLHICKKLQMGALLKCSQLDILLANITICFHE